jgi:hypothetical protein
MEDGGWRMEDGGWRMEDGGWRMEDGGWRKEEGGRRKKEEYKPDKYSETCPALVICGQKLARARHAKIFTGRTSFLSLR